MRWRVAVGVILCVAGVVWIVQGTNVLHGSSMSGRGAWTAIGAVVVVIGLAFLISARRRRANRSARHGTARGAR